MKTLKNTLLTGAALATAGVTNTYAAINPDSGKTNYENLKGANESADNVLVNWINNLMGFLTLVWVVLALWGGFQILTAGEDEEKVGKWKKIIMNTVIGLAVLFIANSLITFAIDIIWGAGQ